MRNIKDVLRLKYVGKLSHERIAVALGISKGVVTKYAGLANAAGLNWQQVQPMDGGCQDSCRIKLVAQAASCVG